MDLKDDKVWLLLLCLMTGSAYYFLHENFNIYYEDDSWTISNVWNFYQLGIEEDLLFLEADDPGRKHVFSKVYNILVGLFLSTFGWTKSNVFLLNSLFIFLSTLVWWYILRQLPISKKIRRLVIILLPISPPLFFAAHTGRPDAMTFLLVSILFLAFINKRYVLATFLLVMAAETHIMGIIGGFYMLAYLLYKRANFYGNPNQFSKLLVNSGMGLLLGIGYYWLLHQDTFVWSNMLTLISSKTNMVSPFNNYLLTYFTDFDWQNHVLEFILLMVTTTLFFKNKLYRKNQFISIFLLVLILSTFLTRRENRNYMIYVFPAILLMYGYTYEQLKKLPQFIGAIILLLSIQYSSIFYAHRTFSFQQVVGKVNALCQEKIPIVGMPDIWFAAQNRTFYPIHTHRDFNQIDLKEFYLVESDFLAHRNRAYQPLKEYLFKHYEKTLAGEWVAFQDKKMRIWKLTNHNKSLPKFIKQEYPGWRKVVQNYLLAEF